MPEWLFGECYQAVGDFAETMALLLPPAASLERPAAALLGGRAAAALARDGTTRRGAVLVSAWREMDERQRFAWNKLITGEFRVGVSQNLVMRAMAEASGLDAAAMAHRLMGDWQPTPEFWRQLMAPDTRDADISRPYPFFLAYPLEGARGGARRPIAEWQVEWKWDGIRAQLIRRRADTFCGRAARS